MPIEIKGIEEIKARLDKIAAFGKQRALQRRGIRMAAKVLLAAQKQYVPFETGKLEDALGIQVKRRGDDMLFMVGPDKRLNFIGRFHEFGWNTDPAKFRRNVTAAQYEYGTRDVAGTHWMQKAFDASAKEALEACTKEITRLLDKPRYEELVAELEAMQSEGDDE